MARWVRWVSAAGVVLVTSLAVAGCGADEPDPPASSPDGGIWLRENIPTPLDDLTVIASNIDDDHASLSASRAGEVADSSGAKVGETVTVAGRDFTLVSVRVDDSDGPPGSSQSYAWVVPSAP
ncbi:hypothetical protein [Cellulomonas sp. URHE0023]|uniref:hypothetical protein n=1 Tax=Cellulomonas sp. URHE0023 TaxID=1380354 RepID=UPI000485AEED|nr:hypothetical protein [Cellulomonas sp. URHE0023]